MNTWFIIIINLKMVYKNFDLICFSYLTSVANPLQSFCNHFQSSSSAKVSAAASAIASFPQMMTDGDHSHLNCSTV
jgi:hypothetical protein